MAPRRRQVTFFELLESLGENAWQQHLDTTETSISAAFWTALGHDLSLLPLRRKAARKLLHPVDARLAAEEVKLHLRAEEPFELEVRMRAAVGEWRCIRLRGCVTEWRDNGQPVVIGGIISDITDAVAAARKQSSAEHLVATLSKRELEVVSCLVAGAASKNIAHGLGLSQRTIEGYRARIMDKLGVRGVSALVQVALSGGVTRGGPVACGL